MMVETQLGKRELHEKSFSGIGTGHLKETRPGLPLRTPEKPL
jgi:hypothetical protein